MKVADQKPRILLMGTLTGAVVGLATAFLLAREAEADNGELNITTGDLLKTAMTIVGTMRGVAALGGG